MKKIRVCFVDQPSADINPVDTLAYRLLKKRYEIEVTDKNPQYIFGSVYSANILKYDGIRILWTGESISPDFNLYDYAIAFDNLKYEDRYFRRPLWMDFHKSLDALRKRGRLSKRDAMDKSRFCTYVYSNSDGGQYRQRLFEELSKYKKVDAGGKDKNNIGKRIGDKLIFQRESKFVIACENGVFPGYTSEKLLDAFASEAIPIYWGNPQARMDFNEEAFINCHRFGSIDAVVDEIKRLDHDLDAYLEKLNKPSIDWQLFDKRNSEFENWFYHIFDQEYEEAKRRKVNKGIYRYEKKTRRMARSYDPVVRNIILPVISKYRNCKSQGTICK